MIFKKRCFARLICLCVVMGSLSFCKAQSYAYSGGKGIRNHHNEKSGKNKSLREALSEVGTKYNVSFVYLDQLVENKVVAENANSKNVNLEEDLTNLLKGFHLVYRKVSDKQIAILEATVQKAEKKEETKAEEIKTTIQQSKADIIRGKVTGNNDNSPLAGATITVKGKNRSVVSDADGNFQINANVGDVLLVEFVNYQPKEVTVSGQSLVAVSLTQKETYVGEVVVTALGIRREAKRLGYSTATVNTEEITTNRTTNVANALEGKVAGLNVSPPAGGPGGSSKIRIRGQSSFGGNNSPLIVVNGVPFNNTSISGGGSNGNGTGNPTGGSSDQGDGMQSINPDDIESMTVLKGGPAAALYGYRAKDGAIIITTKSGRNASGIGVELNSNFQAEQALDYTNFQYIYGQGEFGKRQTSVTDAQSSGVFSFGEKFDGKPTPQFDGSTQPYLPHKDRISKFYRIGANWNNSIALSGSNEKGGFRLAFSNTDANAIMPNSDYHRKVLNLGLNYKLTPQLSVQLNANYSNEYNHNPPQIGIQDMNANTTIYTLANSIDVEWLKHRKDANGNEMPLSRFTNRNNPYWVAYDRFENVRRDRIFGNTSLRYQFTDWLYLQGRIGQDYYTRPYNYDRPTGTRSIGAVTTGFNGYYYQDITTFRERNMDFILGGNHTWGKFGLDALFGGNQMQQVYDNMSTAVTNFYVKDLYTITNGQIKNPNYSYSKKKVNSLYASAELSYNNLLFLTLTGRNDWFSTLNPKSDSYLYPSASASFVFSQAFSNLPSWLSFGKLRAAYSEVGGDTDPYSNSLYYNLNANPFNGVALGSINNTVSPNANLRPLKVKEAEAGLELRMFNSRVNLDLSAYNKNTVDEILNVDISNASGYGQTKVNIGKLRNRGVEMLLTFVPVKRKGFNWETSFNGSYNQSKVISLANGQQRFDVGTGEFFGFVSHEVGMPLASLRGFDYKRDPKGAILLSGGLPQQGNIVTYGSAIPKYVGGWLNTINFKGFRIFTQVDFKAGNKILSNSNLNFLREGLSQQSLVGREGGVVFNGVNTDGSANTKAVEAEQFYTAYRSTNIATPFVYNGSFVKWRTISVGYDLSRFATKMHVKGLFVSLLINNVLTIKKYIDNLDPEAQVSVSDNLQGIETHTLPTTRSYGINLNVKF